MQFITPIINKFAINLTLKNGWREGGPGERVEEGEGENLNVQKIHNAREEWNK